VVSKKGLPLIRGYPVESETGRKRTPKSPQSLERRFSASVTGNLELARTGNPDFDLVAFLEFQSLDHCSGQANR
jgi:hypothetical protein